MRNKVHNSRLNLFSLPFVVQDHILSYLTISEHLKLRLVCTGTKEWVDRSSNKLAQHIPVTVLNNHGEYTFKQFCRKRIPHLLTNMFLECESLGVYNDVALTTEFLARFAHAIKKVHVTRYFISSHNGKQTEFFESLQNLEELETDEVWVADDEKITLRIPESFRRLKTLKLGRVKIYKEATNEPYSSVLDIPLERRTSLRWHAWTILDVCDELTYFRVPLTPKYVFDNTFDECFKLLNFIRVRTRAISDRGIRAQRSQQAVMRCDINRFSCCISSLEVLLIVGARMRIQFLNVNSKVFKRGSSFCRVGVPPRARLDYIYSFASTSLVNRKFEHIQKLTFRGSLIQNECILGREKGPALFPNLKEFDLILDTGFDTLSPTAVYSRPFSIPLMYDHLPPVYHRNVCFPRADQVLKFFFPENMEYPTVRSASIIFTEPIFQNQRKASPDRLSSLENVIHGLPRVTKLKLGGWNCKKETYLRMWHAFPNLETLTLDRCSTLTASCFVDGCGNPNNPENFPFLKGLQVLEFNGLEEMPGIANRVSYRSQTVDILSRMGFVEFKLLSSKTPRLQRAVWMRHRGAAPELNEIQTKVTRSVSKVIKRTKK